MRSLRWLSISTNRAKASTQFRTSKKRRDWIPIIGITSVRHGSFRTRTVITAQTFAKKFRSSTANPITNHESCRTPGSAYDQTELYLTGFRPVEEVFIV